MLSFMPVAHRSEPDAHDAAPPGAEPEPASPLPAQLQRIELKLDLLMERIGDAPAGGGHSGDADTAVDGVAGTAPVPAALVDDLRLAKSNLAQLSERVESLERRLSEKFEPIDEAAQSVRKTTQALTVTGKALEASARANEWAQARVTKIEDGGRQTQVVCVRVECGHPRRRPVGHRNGARPAPRPAVARFTRKHPARRVRAGRTRLPRGARRAGP